MSNRDIQEQPSHSRKYLVTGGVAVVAVAILSFLMVTNETSDPVGSTTDGKKLEATAYSFDHNDEQEGLVFLSDDQKFSEIIDAMSKSDEVALAFSDLTEDNQIYNIDLTSAEEPLEDFDFENICTETAQEVEIKHEDVSEKAAVCESMCERVEECGHLRTWPSVEECTRECVDEDEDCDPETIAFAKCVSELSCDDNPWKSCATEYAEATDCTQ